jgi:hypothetical protein
MGDPFVSLSQCPKERRRTNQREMAACLILMDIRWMSYEVVLKITSIHLKVAKLLNFLNMILKLVTQYTKGLLTAHHSR